MVRFEFFQVLLVILQRMGWRRTKLDLGVVRKLLLWPL